MNMGALKSFWSGCLVGVILVVSGCQRGPDTEDGSISVFAAASLIDVLLEVGEAFESETGIGVAFNFAGSNVLAQQIAVSSRADLFISADELWMDFLEEKRRIDTDSRRGLLSNRLVLIGAAKSNWELDRPEDLCSLPYRFLCIGDPDSVPAGRYAREWLDRIPCEGTTAWDEARERVSPTPDVRAALAQVASRDDSIGIVYRTDVLSAEGSVRILLEASSSEVSYPIALLLDGPNRSGGEAFYQFVRSEAAMRVFKSHGFEGFAEL